MRQSLFNKCSVLLLCLAASRFAYGLDPAPYKLGGLALVPTLGINDRYQSNLLLQEDNVISSNVLEVQPNLKIAAVTDSQEFLVDLDFEAGRYSNSSEDNYDDYAGAVAYKWTANSRNELTLGSRVEKGHEARGTGYSEGGRALFLDSPDTLRDLQHKIQYKYGAKSAKGRLVFAAEAYSREYTSRPDVTAYRNRDGVAFSSALFLRAGGRTDAVFEVRGAEVKYGSAYSAQDFGTLDSTAMKYLVGMSWEATGKTEGNIRVGQATKRFESPLREDFSGFNWEVEASWAPKTYSKVTLSTSREPQETDGTGSFIDIKSIALSWQHGWSDRLRSYLSIASSDETYVDSQDDRAETTNRLGLSVDYAIQRWMDIGGSIGISNKDATNEGFDYDSNTVSIYMKWSL